MIEPTVGRVVWFYPSEDLAIELSLAVSSGDTPQPLAASVAYVHSPRMVNLSVTDHSGMQFALTSVRLLQDADTPTDGESYAEWMPYQIGQAQKHAADASAKVAAA